MDEWIKNVAVQMPFVALLAWALWKLYRELSRVQEARVQDANKVTDKVLTIAKSIDKNTAIIERLVSTRSKASQQGLAPIRVEEDPR